MGDETFERIHELINDEIEQAYARGAATMVAQRNSADRRARELWSENTWLRHQLAEALRIGGEECERLRWAVRELNNLRFIVDEYIECPVCGERTGGHVDDCELGAALTSAGAVTP